MKAVGIIAEYNPLHNGHVYHLEQAVRIAGSDAVVVAMSGDYVQRGEPAILDKWARTRMALDAGADLVIEIPSLFCLADASRYAGAGVKCLEALKDVTAIAFGSESGDAGLISTVSGRISGDERLKEVTARIMNSGSGLSYPAARLEAYKALFHPSQQELDILRSPNDILALEYIMASSRLIPVAVRRSGAGYNEGLAEHKRFQSATAVRQCLRDGCLPDGCVPDTARALLLSEKLTFPDEWTDVLRYAVMSSEADVIEDCPSGGEGLCNLMKKAAVSEDTWDGFISVVKSKRYTYTRISRLCMQVILGITRTRFPYDRPEYIRVLGATAQGRKLLAGTRDGDRSDLPVITNINKDAAGLSDAGRRMLELDAHAADIYDLVTGRDLYMCSDHVVRPVML